MMPGDFYIFTVKKGKSEMNGKGKIGKRDGFGSDSYISQLDFQMEEILKIGLDTPNNVVFS